tara:strand:+ start:286 stop:591 length:306 start_codon:yes stop_codon:yes gene_type:complete
MKHKSDSKSKKAAAEIVIAVGIMEKPSKKTKNATKKANIGGMMMGNKKKINPTTGLSMNKGGMMKDYRKTGMFYGGGMTFRGQRSENQGRRGRFVTLTSKS